MQKPFAEFSFAVIMNSILCIKKSIKNIIDKSAVPEDPIHARNTLEWLLKLNPDAGEALKIAAFGHDIERALESRKVKRTDFSDFNEFKAAHARNSAVILMEIMKECVLPDNIKRDVYRIVCLHETGGDPHSDIVRDADGISFFEVNLPFYIRRNSLKETKRRCSWGYKRLSADAKSVISTLSYGNKKLEDLVKVTIDETIESPDH